MKYGGFLIVCDCCGSINITIIHRQRNNEDYTYLMCVDCKQEAEI
jgi:hypothetical protein